MARAPGQRPRAFCDVGVGGGIADSIGQKLAKIAQHKQVLCITHLAQIACFADRQLYISKSTEQGSTTSQVQVLDTQGRIQEIMRMTGGTNASRSARANAKELLAMAAQYKKKEFGNHENHA